MSLNTIKLDPQLLADLYPDQLIDSGTTTAPEMSEESIERRAEEKKSPNFLGNNGKKILVLVSHETVPFLPDDELNFLTSILAACKLSMADIAIANIHTMDEGTIDSLVETESRNVLLFGPGPSDIGLPINFPRFQLQQFNKRNYLHAPTLSELERDKEQKKQLWISLKKLFGL